MEVDYSGPYAHATPWRMLVRSAAIARTAAAIVEMVPVLGIQGLAPSRPRARTFRSIAGGLLGAAAYGDRLVFFGLPIALATRWSLRRGGWEG